MLLVGIFVADETMNIAAAGIRNMIDVRVTKGIVEKQATKLRFPILLFITGSLLIADLLLPDFIPFVDEILLGLVTIVLARLRTRKAPAVIIQEPTSKN